MFRRLIPVLAAALLFAAGLFVSEGARAAREELVIVMTPFPSTFSPVNDSLLAKS